MDWDAESLKAIGGAPAGTTVESIMRYVAGCMKRERERVGRILAKHGYDPAMIQEITSDADDEKVFKWVGPGAKLDDPAPERKG